MKNISIINLNLFNTAGQVSMEKDAICLCVNRAPDADDIEIHFIIDHDKPFVSREFVLLSPGVMPPEDDGGQIRIDFCGEFRDRNGVIILVFMKDCI